MLKGVVRWFRSDLGYGFIVGDDGQDIYVHFSTIQMDGYKQLTDGQEVEYEIGEGQRGRFATKVVPGCLRQVDKE
jgi:CspA family cold shock protein